MEKLKTAFRLLIGSGAITLVGQLYAQSGIEVVVNNEPVYFRGAGPQSVNGRVLVPLRGVLEKLGAYVDWQPAGQLVTASRGDIDITLRVGSRNATVNGRTVTLDVPAMIIRGSTMVPLRFVSEALGADVRWDAARYAVIITTAVTDSPPSPPRDPFPREVSITSFTMDREGWLEPGSTVRFTLRGTPNGEAVVNIPGFRREIVMDEREPGVYTATWTVPDSQDGLDTSRIVPTARLRIGTSERVIQASDEFSVDRTAPVLRSISPEPDARITAVRPTISASFDDRAGSGVDPRSVRIYLDGREVTESATITESSFSYRPSSALRTGEHDVRITARDLAGNRLDREWRFEIDSRGDGVIRSFDVFGADDPRPGDVLRFVLEAEAGGRATFSIGDLVRNRTMTERQPGRYEGTYTVRSGDVFDTEAITARFTTRSGETYTIESTDRLNGSDLVLERPRITSPRADAIVRDPLVVIGTAPDGARVLVRVEYSTDVAGVRLRGAVGEVTAIADENGRWETAPISLDTLVRGRDTTYTVIAVVLGSGGRRSEEARVTVSR